MQDHDQADGFDEHAAADGIQLELWKRLLRYALPYKKELVLLGAGGALTALMEIALPLIAKGVVDDVEQNGIDASFGLWAAAYAGANLLLALGGAIFIWMAGKIDAFASHDIRRDAFANLQRLSFSYFDHRPVGWLMARLTADCRKLTDILAWAFLDLVWGTTMMVGIAAAMLVMHWQLALVAMAVMPAVGWLSAKFRKRILTTARLVRSTNSRISLISASSRTPGIASHPLVSKWYFCAAVSGTTARPSASTAAKRTASVIIGAPMSLSSTNAGGSPAASRSRAETRCIMTSSVAAAPRLSPVGPAGSAWSEYGGHRRLPAAPFSSSPASRSDRTHSFRIPPVAGTWRGPPRIPPAALSDNRRRVSAAAALAARAVLAAALASAFAARAAMLTATLGAAFAAARLRAYLGVRYPLGETGTFVG